jgi:hypothetical protein
VAVDLGVLAQWIGALGVIGGMLIGVVRFLQKLGSMDRKLDDLLVSQQHLTKGTLAALKGLKEQGCNGPVAEALLDLEHHMIQQAYR